MNVNVLVDTLYLKESINKIQSNQEESPDPAESKITCDLCQKQYATMSGLKNHLIMSHNGEIPFECDVCERRFPVRRKLILHQYTHTGEKPHKCKICHKGFCEISRLKTHQRVHTGEKPFVCDICQKGFYVHGHLKVHKLIHEEKKFGCNICDRKFSNSTALNEHFYMHTGEKPFVCDICDKSFSMKKCLQRHTLCHSEEKSYVCDVCQKAFFEKSRLTAHKLTHTRTKAYACDICQRRFYKESKCKSHKLTHNKTPRFKCDKCSKGFMYRCDVNRHKCSSVKRKLVCHTCLKVFSERSLLIDHCRTHTEDKPFMCDVCGEKFSVKVFLDKHLQYHTLEELTVNKIYMDKDASFCDTVENNIPLKNLLTKFIPDVNKKETIAFNEISLPNNKIGKKISEKLQMKCCNGTEENSISSNNSEIVLNESFTSSDRQSVSSNSESNDVKDKPSEDASPEKNSDIKKDILGLVQEKIYLNTNGEIENATSACISPNKLEHIVEWKVNDPDQVNSVLTAPFLSDVDSLFSSDARKKKRKRKRMSDPLAEKPFFCNVCQKAFTQKYLLVSHYRMHSGEKPYSCEICSRKFSHKSNYNRHKKTHTGEKPFKCDVCEAQFTQKYHLKQHIIDHRGEKPFLCHVCHESFSKRYSLKMHFRIHTGEKPFICDICQKCFSRRGVLTKHHEVHTKSTKRKRRDEREKEISQL